MSACRYLPALHKLQAITSCAAFARMSFCGEKSSHQTNSVDCDDGHACCVQTIVCRSAAIRLNCLYTSALHAPFHSLGIVKVVSCWAGAATCSAQPSIVEPTKDEPYATSTIGTLQILQAFGFFSMSDCYLLAWPCACAVWCMHRLKSTAVMMFAHTLPAGYGGLTLQAAIQLKACNADDILGGICLLCCTRCGRVCTPTIM